MTAMRVDLPYLSAETDRHGNERLYVRRNGRRIRLRFIPGSPGFLDAYTAAVEALAPPQATPAPRITAAPYGSLGWLGASYFASPEFKALDARSQRTRRLILEECFREPVSPRDTEPYRNCPVSAMGAKQVQVIRNRKADKPGAANNRLKYLSAMFAWAVENGHMRANPARDVKPLRYQSAGFYTWTVDDVRQFEGRHPVGTKARLALALLLFTGARRGDVVTFGRQHVKDGWLRFVPSKTRYRRTTLSEKPVLPELARIIAASPTGDLTFLVTQYGRPFTPAGFGNWFRQQCDDAGLPQCTAHGLRKAGATILAEAGATDRQLMSIYDWTTAGQANVYTAAANRKRLAAEGMKLLAGTSDERLTVSPDCRTEAKSTG